MSAGRRTRGTCRKRDPGDFAQESPVGKQICTDEKRGRGIDPRRIKKGRLPCARAEGSLEGDSGGYLLSRSRSSSTIGVGGLDCRVRDGNGYGPAAIASGNCLEGRSASCSGRKASCAMRFFRMFRRGSDRVRGGRGGRQAARPISTPRLNPSQCLHLAPIEVVIFHRPTGSSRLRETRSWDWLRA